MAVSEGLLVAIGLALIIEGLLPFIAPAAWRRAMTQAVQQSDGAIRGTGLVALLLGLLVLWLV